jgi:hypothetical protein
MHKQIPTVTAGIFAFSTSPLIIERCISSLLLLLITIYHAVNPSKNIFSIDKPVYLRTSINKSHVPESQPH